MIFILSLLLTSTLTFSYESPWCEAGSKSVLPNDGPRKGLFSSMSDLGAEFDTSPDKFTRQGDKIAQGAVYDANGKIICILNSDFGAYIYNPDAEVERDRRREFDITQNQRPSKYLCEKIKDKSKKLPLSNGDLLNRLHWSVSEGNCNPIIKVKHKGGEITPILPHTPIYYQGFVLNNLRQKYNSEREMLMKACNAGPGKDYYKAYFIEGLYHSADSFALVSKPFSWSDKSDAEAAKSHQLVDRIRFCFKDLLESQTTPLPYDPSKGKFQWNHSKHGCRPNNISVHYNMLWGDGTSEKTYCCFSDPKDAN